MNHMIAQRREYSGASLVRNNPVKRTPAMSAQAAASLATKSIGRRRA
jgi:hypothetical protein